MLDLITTSAHYLGAFLLIISVIVFIHEYGHYLVARLCGVRVEQFSIGFGKEMWGWNDKHGTRWKLSILPIGGYVKMFGDAGEASTPDKTALEQMTEAEKAVSFQHKSLPRKAAIVSAGPIANFLLAIVILTGFFMVLGRPLTLPVVGEVLPESAAAQAGLQPGDRFVEFAGRSMENFADIQRVSRLNPGQPLELVIEREGKTLTLTITPTLHETTDMFGNPVRVGLLGVSSGTVEYTQLNFGQALVAAVVETWQMCADTLHALGQMISGQRSVEELGGPIKIAKYSGQSAEQGISTVLWFMALLSINLGLINLFPIPLLDGGHLMFYAIEGLSGRPLAEKFQTYAFRLGMAFIVTLMVFTTVNDVWQLVK